MKRNSVLLWLVIALTVLNIGLISMMVFFKPPGAMPPFAVRPDLLVIKRLDFDKEQQRQFEVIKLEHKERAERLDTELSVFYAHLFLLHTEGDVSESRIDSLYTAIGANRVAMEKNTFDHFQKIKKICRADQLPAFDSLVIEIGAVVARRQR